MEKQNKINNQNRKSHTRVGITWKMFAILSVFILTILLVIWFFQVKMLNYFYLTTKFSELELSISNIENCIVEGKNDLNTTVFDASEEYSADIYVLKVDANKAEVVVSANGPTDTIMPIMTDNDIIKLCNLAYSNGGTYVATVSTVEGMGNQKSEIFGGEYEDAVEAGMKKAKKGPVSAVYAKIVQDGDAEYIIIQNSELTPVGATVKTLQKQFLWIGVILLLLALALAVIISKVITKPIIKINEAAKTLGKGRYDSDFKVKGYREISELSTTLSAASEELAKSDNLQKELIANVSHDLRTPLTMIKGYSEVMRDIPGENTPENVQVIIDETQRLSELVNDMLDVSKIRAGTRTPVMTKFSLTQTVKEVMQRYEKLTLNDGYKIDFEADGEAFVYADRSMILQVIYNLINNAINYTGEDKSVKVRQSIFGGRVRISVEDTGEGIEKDKLPLIFDRYYKVDKVHKRATVGTGLGLSIVKGVLELHKAAYGVESTVGKGSDFWFELDTEK